MNEEIEALISEYGFDTEEALILFGDLFESFFVTPSDEREITIRRRK